jgi:hypothetical protein
MMAIEPTSNGNAFQSGDDFISFDLHSPSSSPGPSGNNADKGKGRATPDDKEESRASSSKVKERGKPKKNGKAYKGSSKKRKAMEDEVAVESIKKGKKEKRVEADSNTPWTAHVDWEGCRDPAEMSVCPE